jgi:ketosteroid isomerase-like protein
MKSMEANAGMTIGELLARTYLIELQAKNEQGILDIIADDFSLTAPLNVPGTNDLTETWSGIDGAHVLYDMSFATIDVIHYVDLEFTAAKDPNIAFAEGIGIMKMTNGRPYQNRYIFRFDTEGGKIKRIWEYTNPVTSAVAFGLPLPVSAPANSLFAT